MLRIALVTCLVSSLTLSPFISAAQVPDIGSMSDAAFGAYLEEFKRAPAVPMGDRDFAAWLTRDEAATELRILRRVLEEAQTSLHRFCTPPELDSCFAGVLPAGKDSVSYLEMVRALARIQNTIACGHSGWSHSKEFRDYRKAAIRLFPFELEVREERYFLSRNLSLRPDIPLGCELLSLNGVPMDKLTADLRRHMYRDGESADRSFREIEHYFSNAYSNFIANPAEFVLKLRCAEGQAPKTETVSALLHSQMDSMRSSQTADVPANGLPLSFSPTANGTAAIYRIRSFNKELIAAQGQDFEQFTDSAFAAIRHEKIRNLVLDLRGNTGGWTAHGKYLFSYFIFQEMDYLPQVEIKKFQDFSFAPIVAYGPGYLDTFDLQLKPSGRYEWRNYPSLRVVPPAQNSFRGRLIVLIDGDTRSCSAILTSMLREHTRAVFVGEETGGARCGSGGMVMGIRLPVSGIGYHFSTAQYSCAVRDSTDSRGVVPEYRMESAAGVDGGSSDPIMEKVLGWLEAEGGR